jgi:branched-chain amino acid aminotransferase
MKKARYISLDGKLMSSSQPCLNHDNRGLLYGDCFTVRGRGNSSKMFFFYEYYEYIEKQFAILGLKKTVLNKPEILNTDIELLLQKCRIYQGFTINISYFRKSLIDNTASVLISVEADANQNYPKNNKAALVEVFYDFRIPEKYNLYETNVFSPENIRSLVYLKPKIDNLILLNHHGIPYKTIDASLVYIKSGSLIFPETKPGGCLNIINAIIEKIAIKIGIRTYHKDITVTNLDKLDELFLINPISGIQPVAGLGERRFQISIVKDLIKELSILSESSTYV